MIVWLDVYLTAILTAILVFISLVAWVNLTSLKHIVWDEEEPIGDASTLGTDPLTEARQFRSE